MKQGNCERTVYIDRRKSFKKMIDEADAARKEIKTIWGEYFGRSLKVSNRKLPFIYFLRKTHKGKRAIVSNIDSPSEKIAAFLVHTFEALTPPISTSVENSIEFTNSIVGIKYYNVAHETDEIMHDTKLFPIRW